MPEEIEAYGGRANAWFEFPEAQKEEPPSIDLLNIDYEKLPVIYHPDNRWMKYAKFVKV